MPLTAITSKAQFTEALEDAGKKLVVVDFFAVWCGPCKTIGPVVEKLSNQFTNVVFLKVDVDKVEELASDHNISSMPTFVFFKAKTEVDRFSGASEVKLNEIINKYK